jgi:hypothetical protein
MNNGDQIVREEFGSLCRTFNLTVKKMGDDEIALIGGTFVLLVWLDREGVSVKYIRLDREKFEAIDVGRFLVLKRGWIATELPSKGENIEDRLRRECSSYALNIQQYGAEILMGQTEWMKEVTGSPIVLSEVTKKAIQTALGKTGERRSV